MKKRRDMYSKSPSSLYRLPRLRGYACVSLRTICILSAVATIVYSVVLLSIGLASVAKAPLHSLPGWVLLIVGLATHTTTLMLSALMLNGAIKEQPCLIRPWVVFRGLQLAAAILVFIVGTALRVADDMDASTMPFVCAEFLSILIWSYLLVAVASYARELEDASAGAEMARLKRIDYSWYTKLPTTPYDS